MYQCHISSIELFLYLILGCCTMQKKCKHDFCFVLFCLTLSKYLTLLVFFEPLRSVGWYLSLIWKIISHFNFEYLFLPILSFFSYCHYNSVCDAPFEIVSQLLGIPFIFLHYVFPLPSNVENSIITSLRLLILSSTVDSALMSPLKKRFISLIMLVI